MLDGRFRLATVVRDTDGRDVLATHAAVTRRELDLLVRLGFLSAENVSANPSAPEAVARALNTFLDAAVERWRTQAAGGAPLDLAPLYVGGSPGEEAGGLLYHRPANDDAVARGPFNHAWEFHSQRPRRYTPQALPTTFSQLCGHTPHRRAQRELAGFTADKKGADGHVRTLVCGVAPRYLAERLPPAGPGEVNVYYIDAEIATTEPEAVEGFWSAGWPEDRATKSGAV